MTPAPGTSLPERLRSLAEFHHHNHSEEYAFLREVADELDRRAALIQRYEYRLREIANEAADALDPDAARRRWYA